MTSSEDMNSSVSETSSENDEMMPEDEEVEYSQLSDAEKELRTTGIPMDIKDGMDFFRFREGQWDSWRVTHHLAFRRAESGESRIKMECLEPTDERISNLCKDWEVDPSKAQGGCYVTWKATLDWDQEGENHEGSTIFALVPDDDDRRRGRILRDRGYAEIVPITGTYFLDDRNDLNLETPYDGGAVIEKFSFDGPNVVNRMSTVKRFGGFSNATFAMEQRVGSDVVEDTDDEEADELLELMEFLPFFVAQEKPEGQQVGRQQGGGENNTIYKRSTRWGAPVPQDAQPPASSAFSTSFSSSEQGKSSKPSPTSAFSSGFSSGPSQSQPPPAFPADDLNGGVVSEVSESEMERARAEAFAQVSQEEVSEAISNLASKAGIDLSKIPPSMRDDFLASFEKEGDKKK